MYIICVVVCTSFQDKHTITSSLGCHTYCFRFSPTAQ